METLKNLSRSFYDFLKKNARLTSYVLKIVFKSQYSFFLFKVLSSIWPILLLLVVIYGFLTLMDQVRDLMDALIQDITYSTFAFVGLLVLSLVTWYAVKIILVLRDQTKFAMEDQEDQKGKVFISIRSGEKIGDSDSTEDSEGKRVLELFIRWIPVAFGVFPFLFFLSVLQKVEDAKMHVFIWLVLLISYLFFVCTSKGNYYTNTKQSALQQNAFADLLPIHRRVILSIVLIAISFCILITIWRTNIIISNLLGPIAVSMLAFAIWICVASFFSYLDYIYRVPFTLLCILLMTMMNNNNHQIRTIQANGDHKERSYFSKNGTVPVYFKKWLDYRIKKDNDSIPVYLIATEGGGIRSAFWTATVLNNLELYQREKKGVFFSNVFAISGVSGGSMGATLFTAQYRDNLLNPKLEFKINNYFKKDFLSPLLSALLIPDMIQKFLPIKFNGFDRAQYLEDSWAAAYKDVEIQTFRNDISETSPDNHYFETFDKPFMDLWKSPKNDFNYQIPVLFLNSTQVETGRKAILTPLDIRQYHE